MPRSSTAKRFHVGDQVVVSALDFHGDRSQRLEWEGIVKEVNARGSAFARYARVEGGGMVFQNYWCSYEELTLIDPNTPSGNDRDYILTLLRCIL